MSKNKIRAHIVLDKSGSMAANWPKTLEAVNSYVKELASDKDINAKVSLTAFCSASTVLVRDDIKAEDFKPLTVEDVNTGGMTPLRDAVGGAITTLREKGSKRRKALVVMTDGYENASREISAEALKAMIEKCQKDDWLVLYLGADHDAWGQAKAMGFSAQHVGQYDQASVGATMAVATANTRIYASGATAQSVGFDDDDRAKMMGKKKAEIKSPQQSDAS